MFSFLWPPCAADADITLLPCGFFYLLLLLLLFSSPNLSRRRLDVYRDTSTHGVALVLAHGSLEMQDAKKSPSGHRRTTLSGHVFTTKACIDNRKKTCQTTISPPHVLTIW